ncbi:hypothetical protein QZH41_017817 [Actinostola sp. cb2023]|nr:hypothetical protein QZH41_017817 [Actinostola sp. cb2023]
MSKLSIFEVEATASTDDAKQSNKNNSRRIAIEDTIVASGKVKFADIAGLRMAKETLREAIIMPLQYPHLFTGGRRPWRRILLYGPPGTAVASEVRSTFYSVSSSDLISSWVGESEKLIKELFHDARDRQGRSVIFIDEIDSICRKRSTREEEHTRRIKTELLKQMEGVGSSDNERYFLLCATNCPWELDSAFLRRFQKRIYIPLPEKEARIDLMKMHLGSTPAQLTEQDWSLLGDRTEGYSGSDLANCISDALFEPIRELQHARYWKHSKEGLYEPCSEKDSGASEGSLSDLDIPHEKVHPRHVFLADFFKSLTHNQRTVTEEDLERYHTFTHSFGQIG